jgi:hypothetical protein
MCIDQRPHRDVNVGSVPNDGKHQGATVFAVGVLAAHFAVDQEVSVTTDKPELGAPDAGEQHCPVAATRTAITQREPLTNIHPMMTNELSGSKLFEVVVS